MAVTDGAGRFGALGLVAGGTVDSHRPAVM